MGSLFVGHGSGVVLGEATGCCGFDDVREEEVGFFLAVGGLDEDLFCFRDSALHDNKPWRVPRHYKDPEDEEDGGDATGAEQEAQAQVGWEPGEGVS